MRSPPNPSTLTFLLGSRRYEMCERYYRTSEPHQGLTLTQGPIPSPGSFPSCPLVAECCLPPSGKHWQSWVSPPLKEPRQNFHWAQPKPCPERPSPGLPRTGQPRAGSGLGQVAEDVNLHFLIDEMDVSDGARVPGPWQSSEIKCVKCSEPRLAPSECPANGMLHCRCDCFDVHLDDPARIKGPSGWSLCSQRSDGQTSKDKAREHTSCGGPGGRWRSCLGD